MRMLNKYKIVLNNKTNLETGLNEIYHELDFLINQIQDEYTKLTENTSLVDMTMEDKSEYAKAVHNFLVNKGNILKLKIELQKVVAEILKCQGNESDAFNNLKKNKSIEAIDIKQLQKMMKSTENETNEETVVYKF